MDFNPYPQPTILKTDGAEAADYPKWVAPHPDLVLRQKAREDQVRPGSENSLRVSDEAPEHISVSGFAHVHVDREGNVSVMVADAEEEKHATSGKVTEPPAKE